MPLVLIDGGSSAGAEPSFEVKYEDVFETEKQATQSTAPADEEEEINPWEE